MLHKVIYGALALLAITLVTACQTDNLDIQNTEDLHEFLLDEMDYQQIPALSVLIFNGDAILHEEYLGRPDIAQNTNLGMNDLFLLASVSKMVTATALLQLYDDGAFELDDNINDHLPFSVSVPNENVPITFRMLLTHTSGIADGPALDDQYYYGEDSPIALDFFLENYLVPGGQFYSASDNFYGFTPGTQHEYSNEGSALIAVLVEQIANQDFNAYCKQHIFQPLGMNNTFWRLDESIQSNNTIVRPYDLSGNQLEPIQHYTFTDYPNGGLRSTARDMHRFLSAFVQGGMSNNHQLLKAATVNSMLSPQIADIDDQVGLHAFVMNESKNLWGHDGGEQGVSTIVAFNRETKVGAIVFSNQGDADLDEILVEAYRLGLIL